jgi:uncharacterized membrane protein YhdT
MSSNTGSPGFRNQAGIRTTFRVLGGVVLVVGVVMFGYGISQVFGSDDVPGGFQIACFMGGLLVIGFGLMLLQGGFMGAAARYAAGETMPVVKDSLTSLSAGRYCSCCGVRNDEGAKFCDSCGSALA